MLNFRYLPRMALYALIIFALPTAQSIAAQPLQTFADITAGNHQGTDVPENAIDGNYSTILYTKDYRDVDPSKNWFQLAFPETVGIDSFTVWARSRDRLQGAKIYLSDAPYPNQTQSDLLEVLGASEPYPFSRTFAAQIQGKYLIFVNDSTGTPGTDEFNFKIEEIQVVGDFVTEKPIVKLDTKTIVLPAGFTNAAGYEIVSNIRVFEPQGQAVTFGTDDSSQFQVVDNGNGTATLKLASTIEKGTYQVRVLAQDTEQNVGAVDLTIEYPFVSSDNIAGYGIATQGTPRSNNQDPRLAIDGDTATFQQSFCAKEHNWWQLELPNLTQTQQISVLLSSAKNDASGKVYLLNAPFNPYDVTSAQLVNSSVIGEFIDTNVTLDFKFAPNSNRFLLIKGDGEQCLSLAEVSVYGKVSAAPQFLSYPAQTTVSPATPAATQVARVSAQDFQGDAITYSLVGNVPFSINGSTGVITVNGALTADTTYTFQARASDGAHASLVSLSMVVPPSTALADALTSGNASSITLGDLYASISTHIAGTSDALDPRAMVPNQSFADVIAAIQQESFTFPLELCETSSWNSSKCESDYPEFKKYWDVSRSIKEQLEYLDRSNTDIFLNPSDENKFLRLLVLLGDKLRENIRFPMDIETTDRHEFLRAYFADHLVYNTRSYAPVQRDMGNLSRSDFSDVTTSNRAIELVSRKPFRSAGVYALPGQTVKVTRRDTSATTAAIVVHSLRYQASHTFGAKEYVRPAFPQSTPISILPGESISFTSVYGGPIQVEFGSNDDFVDLYFENVASHPYWNGPEDTEAFTAAVEEGKFDWAEIATPMYELHSRNFEMRNTLSEWSGGVEEVAKLMMEYTYKHIYTFGGYDTAEYISNTTDDYFSLISLPSDITQFAASKSLSLIPYDIVQHLNADQPWAGYGTAGNPIDRFGNFNPLSHVDLHETGHNVELRSLPFVGPSPYKFELHSVTDLHSYYAQSMFNLARGSNVQQCWEVSFKTLYERIQSGVNDPTKRTPPVIFATKSGEAGGAQDYLQAASIMQILMAAQNEGVVQNGWYIITRMKLLGIAFKDAKESEALWMAARERLGFGSYTWAEATAMSENDWLLVSYSVATGRDLTQFLSVYGHEFSAKAKDQVASFAYSPMPIRFYVSSTTGFCELGKNGDLLGKAWIPIDGTTTWPDEVDADGDGFWDSLTPFTSTDSDGDGVPNISDALPLNPNESVDTDGDGIGNNADLDDDGDGVPDSSDAFPLNPNESADTDGDGVGDNADRFPLNALEAKDSDGDGIGDNYEIANGLDPRDARDAAGDLDGDGDSNLVEFQRGGVVNSDDVAPIFEVTLQPLTVRATAKFTPIEWTEVYATDGKDGRLQAVVDNQGPFESGTYQLTWTATDAAGNTATQVQALTVVPVVSAPRQLSVSESQSVTLTVTMTGAAETDVVIPYRLSGSATLSTDFAVSAQVITIARGEVSGTLQINTVADSVAEGDEDISVELLEPISGASLATNVITTITITEGAQPPRVSLQVIQAGALGVPTLEVSKDGGPVRVEALVTDPNGNHAFDWRGTDSGISLSTTNLARVVTFDPSALGEGFYNLTVQVTDDQLPGQVFAARYLVHIKSGAVERDSDLDGIPDSVDAINSADEQHVIQTLIVNLDPEIDPSQSSSGEFLAQSEVGTKIVLGEVARKRGKRLNITQDDVVQVHGQPDGNYNYPTGLFDFEIRTANAGDTATVVLPLKEALPSGAHYRKFMSGTWKDFVINDKNKVYSAPGRRGFCPAPNDVAYQVGLTRGHYCVQLTIEDGGANDADGSANGTIVDPSGVATSINFVPTFGVTNHPLINKSFSAGGGEKTVMEFTIDSDSSDVVMDSISLATSPAVNATNISRVNLYYDANMNGVFEVSEKVTGLIFSNDLRIDLSTPLGLVSGRNRFKITFDVQ